MRHLLSIATLLIFIPLFLLLLFAMPLEFCASSWHLWRADAATEGRIVSSEQKNHRGNTRSLIRYSYTVDGRSYESDRVRAGWVSNEAFEAGAGSLAQSLSPGSQVTVRYDPAHPEFALLDYGWPKWSVGFSLVVWGWVLGSYVFGPRDRRPRSHLLYGLTRGILLLGFLIIFLLPPTLEPRLALPLFCAELVLAGVAGVYSRLRFTQVA